MKKLILLIAVCLAGCSAGNLSINGQEPFRVSDFRVVRLFDGQVNNIEYCQHGKWQSVYGSFDAYFERTIFHPKPSDVCDETGWFYCD